MRFVSASLVLALLSLNDVALAAASIQDEKTAAEHFQEAIKALQEGKVDLGVLSLEKAFELEPTNPQYGQLYVGMLISSAMAGETTDYDKFLKAESILRTMIETEGIDEQIVTELSPRVFYNAACAYAQKDQTAKAKAVLKEAILAGFKDREQILADEDLADLRDERFEAMIDGLFAEQREAMIKKLTEGEGLFPFDFEVTSVDGKPLKKDNYLGKVLIVDIWGTWCPPCRAEIPHFVDFYEKYQDRGFDIVGLNYEGDTTDAEVAKVKAFMEEFQMPYDCALGTEEIQQQVPNFRGFPTTLYIDREGKVRKVEVGFAPQMLPDMELTIETLLDQEIGDEN